MALVVCVASDPTRARGWADSAYGAGWLACATRSASSALGLAATTPIDVIVSDDSAGGATTFARSLALALGSKAPPLVVVSDRDVDGAFARVEPESAVATLIATIERAIAARAS